MTKIGCRSGRFQLKPALIIVFAAVMFAVSPPHAVMAQLRIAALALINSNNSESTDNDQLIVNTNLITLNVVVTDADGRAVSGLGKNAFTVYDDQVPQEIRFFSDKDAPASVAVVFDTSASMSGDKIVQAKAALARLTETSHNNDEFFLIDFNSHPRLLLNKTRDGDAVLTKLTYVQPRGNTALYDALYLGIEKAMRGAHSKRALIVISDGEDNSSRYSFNELRRRLRESGVMVYALGISVSSLPKSHGRSDLNNLASMTGGKAFFPDNLVEMNEAFEQVALDLRHQYSIGYRPSNFAATGKWHRLKVKVTAPPQSPRLFVRSREGYYALTK